MHPSNLLTLLPLASAMATPSTKRSEPAPILRTRAADTGLIADNYVVKFKDGSKMANAKSLLSYVEGVFGILSGTPSQVYDGAFKGFAGHLTPERLDALRHHPDVEYIEQDKVYSAQGLIAQSHATWGLGRISHQGRGADKYIFDERGGDGTCVYVIDSGIDVSHPDFEGRATWAAQFGGGASLVDTCDHGTHVAGTIGSRTFGVAKKARLFGIKALELDKASGRCTTDMSNIINAMNFAAEDSRRQACPNGVIVNMSLGGQYSKAVNDAAESLSRQGILVVAAAGNDNKDAKDYSPASAPSVCTVGATDVNDNRYAGSNYGNDIDINAPGVQVMSLITNGRSALNTGTSMAAPHVAGLAAYLASTGGHRAGPQSCETMRRMATRDAIRNPAPNTVNLIAFNGNTY